MTKSKVVSRQRLHRLASRLRKEGKRIVTTNGSFDLLTAGHVHLLETAKREGDILFVGVNSDASVRKYKSPNRPIVPQAQRVRVVAALGCVDYVAIFNETTPIRFIEAVRPHVHVNDAAYGRNCVEAPTLKKIGARLKLVRRIAGISTTNIIRKIHDLPER